MAEEKTKASDKKGTVAPVKDTCGSKVAACDCADAFMDKTYGKGMRLHTKKVKSGKISGITCCNCGKTKNR